MIVVLRSSPEVLRQVVADMQALGTVPARTAKRRFEECAPRVVAAQRARCPVDDKDGGQLRASIRWLPVRTRGGRVQLTFAAGGETLLPYIGHRHYLAYPTVQETDVTQHHRVGGAHFMSGPATAEFPRVMARIVSDVQEALRGRA